MNDDQLEQTANFFYPQEQALFKHRHLVYKQEASTSTNDTKLKGSKPSSAQSGQHTPPQIIKKSENCKTIRIFSSNLQRQSYPQEVSQKPTPSQQRLPDIFKSSRKAPDSSQGFRITSGKQRRGTLEEFTQIPVQSEKKELQSRIFQQLPPPKVRTIKLPSLEPKPFLQTGPQQKIINRIFSGKRDQ
ncbi:hypothetical protein pb186bvf_008380 [Paramecium bursaria]